MTHTPGDAGRHHCHCVLGELCPEGCRLVLIWLVPHPGRFGSELLGAYHSSIRGAAAGLGGETLLRGPSVHPPGRGSARPLVVASRAWWPC